jgi:hypothetical protein
MLHHREDLKGKRFVNEEDYESTLITIQFSLENRILIYLADKHIFKSLNGTYDSLEYVNTFYKMFITHFCDSTVEYKKVLQQMDVYSTYLKNKNIDYLFTFYDTPSSSIQKNKNLVSFDGYDLNTFMDIKKIKILHDTSLGLDDSHATVEGNKLIADKFYEHLCEYYG